MAYETQTTDALLADVRSRTDSQTPSGTVDFVTDAEILGWLNTAYREFVDLIASKGDAFIETMAIHADVAVPAGSMPADFYKLVAVDIPDPGDARRYVPLKQVNFRNRNGYFDRAYPRYRIMSGTLVFFPSDTSVTTVRLWYIPSTADQALGDGLFVTYHGWQNFLVASACMAVCAKDERDSTEFKLLKLEARNQILEACGNMVLGDTQTIADVECLPEEFFDRAGRF